MNKEGNLTINRENIFPIIKKWLYSEKDMFIREIAANRTKSPRRHPGFSGAITARMPTSGNTGTM